MAVAVVSVRPVDRVGDISKMSAAGVLRKAESVLLVRDGLVETQVLLKLLLVHVRELVVSKTECPGVAEHRLGILRVDLGIGLVVVLLPFLELSGGLAALVELGEEGVESSVIVSLLFLSASASAAWSGLDDSGGNKSESN